MTEVSTDQFELTFPDREAAFVRAAYAQATSIVEYGSGGSTVLGAGLGVPVLSIESDRHWAERLSKSLPANGSAQVRHVDIGRTKDWGFPASTAKSQDYWHYPMSPWSAPPTTAPDLVLIDGRFRKACFAATLIMTRQPVRILFDDWQPRRSYHEVATRLAPTERIGRLAVFDVTPGLLTMDDFAGVLPWFFDTR